MYSVLLLIYFNFQNNLAPVNIAEMIAKPNRGPAMDRLQAMKAAFRSQYQSQV